MTVSKKPKRPEKHSPRVLAWLTGAINPWIDVAEFENRYTSGGSVSFRHRRRELEHLRPIREQLPPGGRLVLEDLQRFEKPAAEWESSHDDAVRELAGKAIAAFDSLTRSSDGFQALAREVDAGRGLFAKEAEQAASDDRELVLQMAENIVNAQGELSSARYSDAAFWNAWRDRLLRFRQGAVFDEVDRARENLQQVNSATIERLKELRWRIVDEFDVPPSGAYGEALGG